MDDLKMVVRPQSTGGSTRMMMMMFSLSVNLSQEISIRRCEFIMNNYDYKNNLKKHDVRRTNRMTSPATAISSSPSNLDVAFVYI